MPRAPFLSTGAPLAALTCAAASLLASPPARAQAPGASPPRLVSTFWSQADALCARRDALAAAPAGARDAARGEMLDYCARGAPPRFAALSDEARTAELMALYALVGEAPPPPSSIPRPSTSALGEAIERAVLSASLPRLGAAEEHAIGLALGAACTRDVARLAPRLCGLRGRTPLAALRSALLADLLALGDRAARIAASAPEIARARMLLAAISTVVAGGDLGTLAGGLASSAVAGAVPCPAGDATCVALERATRIAAEIVRRLARDAVVLVRAEEHGVRIVEQVLREELGQAGLSLGAEARGQASQIVRAIVELDALAGVDARTAAGAGARAAGRIGAEARADLEARAGEVAALAVSVLQRSVSLGLSALPGLPPLTLDLDAGAVVAMASALGRGDLRAAVLGLLPELRAPALAAAIPAGLPRVLEIATRLSSARTPADFRAEARRVLVPLPPWTERFLFELNGSVPVLREGDFRIAGDLLLGYNGERFGLVGRGALSAYDFRNGAVLAESTRSRGSVEGWISGPLGLGLVFELRGSAEGAYLDARLIVSGGARTELGKDSSLMGRGSLLAGLRWQPASRFALALSAGGGGQFETFTKLARTETDTRVGTETHTSGRGEARLRIQWEALPQILAFRHRSDLSYFRITRDAFLYGVVEGPNVELLDVAELDLSTRLFADLEAARFLGFVPGVHGGLDLALASAEAGALFSTVPVFGVGLRRDTF